ncbi:unnamed protein product [Cuscuta campestris]|uniref:Uncharacterized protein n=1 Tax=Cuscuta campestris TaxID=132261 RepID=A0A484LNT4_9ASTE|nr:unnamed protein product [Cuscuta campestris]
MAEAPSALTYQKFVHFALEETRKHTNLSPSPLQEKFGCLSSIDGKTELHVHSFESPKIRLLRSLCIEGSDNMQVADEQERERRSLYLIDNGLIITTGMLQQYANFAIFPRVEFDLPIFCVNLFTTAAMSKVLLDLNPLHDVITQHDYKKKYYTHLIPLGNEYTELFQWGGKITSESMKFFSPIVIWSKFPPSQQKHHLLCSAFCHYLKSWLQLMDHVTAETDASKIIMNLEAQHRYLTWRAEKVGCLMMMDNIK